MVTLTLSLIYEDFIIYFGMKCKTLQPFIYFITHDHMIYDALFFIRAINNDIN